MTVQIEALPAEWLAVMKAEPICEYHLEPGATARVGRLFAQQAADRARAGAAKGYGCL